uniref:Secretory carrier-associated membrane protein n=1 Tax=Aceria tosichella TaxID=561515 RepID=A0A6G1SCR4_9ACAR
MQIEELERRQQELDLRAAELAAREEALRQSAGEFRRQHNWPPLPSACPLKPCFFQDINVDIRPEFQRTVQLGYHLWISFVFTQLLNILSAILLLSYSVPDAGQNISFGLMTSIFLVPLTYMAWFRPLYKAFKNDSSFNFMVFFFVFFMQTLIVGLWSLGLPAQGPCGLYVAIKNMSVSVFLAIVLFTCTACWMVFTVASVLYLLKVHSIYRSSGASMAKARSEFTQGIISNQYVQQAAVNAARETINQATQPTPPPPTQPNLVVQN